MGADAIEALKLESPKAAGLLLLGAYRAGTSLARALDAAKGVASTEERDLARGAVAEVMGGGLQALIDRIVTLHPEFDVGTWDELKEQLWALGIDPEDEAQVA
jgi:hypothetical protein